MNTTPTRHQSDGRPQHRRTPARSLAVVAALALAVAACGSDEPDAEPPAATSPEATSPEATSPEATSPATDGGGPSATVPTDLPENLLGEIGPLDVIGDALPELTGDIESDPAVGTAAPVLVGTDFDGNTVRVDAAANGPTMVVFLAHWCPHCNAEIPVINSLRDEGRVPDGLDIIAVSTAVAPDRPNFPPSEWIDDMDWTYPVIADGVDLQAGFLAPTAYGLDGFPFVTLIDGEGNVAARWSGESSAEETLDRIATHLDL